MTTEPDENRNEVVDFPPPRDPAERQRAEWRFGGPAGSVQAAAEEPGPPPSPPDPGPPRPAFKDLVAMYAANDVKNPPPPRSKAAERRDPNLVYDMIRCRVCGIPWDNGVERHAESSPGCVNTPPDPVAG